VIKINKKMLIVSMAVLSMLLCFSLANAQEPRVITTWTDKPKYNPGEGGTLYIAFYNNRDGAITIEKVVVTFESWRAYKDGKWEGNQTITVNKAITSGETHLTEAAFTVPTDGRAVSTYVDIKVYTTEAGIIRPFEPPYIYVSEAPNYLEQIVTLFTIQVVLTIVCTIILAATIFLSVRRPQITWRKEEKTE
jgi:hypothetical protein